MRHLMLTSSQLFSTSVLGRMLNGSASILLPMAMAVPRVFGPIVLLYATDSRHLFICVRVLTMAMGKREPKLWKAIGGRRSLFFSDCWMSF